MGKKKSTTKIKEVRVIVAEASSTGETTQHQSQSPRKRGRPRKTIKKTEGKEKNQPEEDEEAVEEGDSKRKKTSVGEKQRVKAIELSKSSSSLGAVKERSSEECKSKEPPKSRGRRKSKPRKSI